MWRARDIKVAPTASRAAHLQVLENPATGDPEQFHQPRLRRSGVYEPGSSDGYDSGLLVIAVIAALMLRSGNDHKSDYDAYQQCKAGSQPFCVLYKNGSQSQSESVFRDNYQNQLLFGKIGIGLGTLVVVAGICVLVARRRPTG